MTGMNKRQEVRIAMLRAETARKRILIPRWGEMGLIAGQPRVLNQLAARDRVTQKELADACMIEPATLSRALDKLEAMGYVERGENPECRRSFLIALTEDGRKKAEEVGAAFGEIEDQMMKGFSEEELDWMKALLDRVYENLK